MMRGRKSGYAPVGMTILLGTDKNADPSASLGMTIHWEHEEWFFHRIVIPTGAQRGHLLLLLSGLDLPLLFPYIGRHARSAFPQVLRGLLQEMRPRRVSRNRQLPCQPHIRGVLAVWREAEISALRSHPWQAAFRGPQKEGPAHLDGCTTRSRRPSRPAPR